ncbi:unnamed protein product, partial [Didymodactylos carnosus]
MDQCLHFNIRSSKLYVGFYYDDTAAGTTLELNQWYHVSFVYDYSIKKQYVYLNGILDGANTPAEPFKGSVGNLTIGRNLVLRTPLNYFDGYLDSMVFINNARTACDIMIDATLAAYYSMDLV